MGEVGREGDCATPPSPGSRDAAGEAGEGERGGEGRAPRGQSRGCREAAVCSAASLVCARTLDRKLLHGTTVSTRGAGSATSGEGGRGLSVPRSAGE